jgi:hypothetical protein
MDEAIVTPNNHQPADSTCVRYPFRIALQEAELRHIPAFAMSAEADREAVELHVHHDQGALEKIAGRGIADALRAGSFGSYCVLVERKRVAPQTVTYSAWFAFANNTDALAFVREFPQFAG